MNRRGFLLGAPVDSVRSACCQRHVLAAGRRNRRLPRTHARPGEGRGGRRGDSGGRGPRGEGERDAVVRVVGRGRRQGRRLGAAS